MGVRRGFLIVLIVWGICSAKSDFDNYDGYVIDIKENEKNQTVITTIAGNKTSEFVLKWSLRKKYEKNVRKIAVGDRVMLSTTRFSDVDIKKIDVHEGYFTEGKLVYVNEAEVPLILTADSSTGLKYLVSKNRLELIIEQMKESEGVTEYMKQRDQMVWVGVMNSIRNRAEEIVLREMIYEEDVV